MTISFKHSCPHTIFFDNSTEFCNEVQKFILNKLKISHVTCSVNNPASNGKVERFHRFLTNCLAKYAPTDHTTWDDFISSVVIAYRASCHDSTKFSPFFLVYGRDRVLPIDTLLKPRPKYSGDDYVSCMLQRLHVAFRIVKDHIVESRQRNKDRLNARARDPTFKPGDAVFYRNPATRSGLSQKLSMRWDPYYRVIEQTGPVNFRIRHQTTGTEHLGHAKYLRACNIQDVLADTPADSESGSDDANGVAHDDIDSDFLEERDSSASSQHIPTGRVVSPVPSDLPDDMLCD